MLGTDHLTLNGGSYCRKIFRPILKKEHFDKKRATINDLNLQFSKRNCGKILKINTYFMLKK